jgi:uncharacterized protein YgbK (DUF1537 family)
MNATVRVLADDLTGAADASAAFLRAGAVRLLLGEDGSWARTDIPGTVALDLDLREEAASEHFARMGDAAAAVADSDVLFLKIDSLLRGRVVEYIGTLRSVMTEHLIVVAPAHPALGRTTLNGVQLLDERPIGSVLSDDMTAKRLDTCALRAGASTLLDMFEGEDTLVVDALSEEDLDRLVRAAQLATRPIAWVGSGGLAHALARCLNQAPERAPAQYPSGNRIRLAVVGSDTETASRQLRVASNAGISVVELSPLSLATPEGRRESSDRVTGALTTGSAVVTLSQDTTSVPRATVSELLASTLKDHLARADDLLLTGGATARSCLLQTGTTSLDVVGETEPGVVLSNPGDGPHRTVTTKSGGFGSDTLLLSFFSATTRERGIS